MSYTSNYNALNTRALCISFQCKKCEHMISSENIYIPEITSQNDKEVIKESDIILCNNCGKLYNITIQSSRDIGILNITDLDKNHKVSVKEINEYVWFEQLPFAKYIIANTNYYQNFLDELNKIRKLAEIAIPKNLQQAYYRSLFSNTIATMETYLSDAFINTILSNERLIAKFYSNYKDFQSENIKMSQLYEYSKQIRNIALDKMTNIIFHNITKVNRCYKEILDVEFTSFGHILKVVDIRHHIVHRNGKDKDGNIIKITKDTIIDLINDIEKWIKDIDIKLNKKHYKSRLSDFEIIATY